MKIKNKKRFMISMSIMIVVVICLVSIITIGIHKKNEEQAVIEKQKAEVEETKENEEATKSVEKQGVDRNNLNQGITQIVNKNHSLSPDYVADDLVVVDLPSTRETQLREEAALALTELFNVAKTEGIGLYCCSGYRSYELQTELYNWNVETYGEAEADLVSAKPGTSEHQMGLAMDVTSESAGFDLLESFGTMPEGEYIKENAYKYGFIIRYLEEKTEITGYAYEPWHLRYVGIEPATEMFKSGQTMEEYYGIN